MELMGLLGAATGVSMAVVPMVATTARAESLTPQNAKAGHMFRDCSEYSEMMAIPLARNPD